MGCGEPHRWRAWAVCPCRAAGTPLRCRRTRRGFRLGGQAEGFMGGADQDADLAFGGLDAGFPGERLALDQRQASRPGQVEPACRTCRRRRRPSSGSAHLWRPGRGCTRPCSRGWRPGRAVRRRIPAGSPGRRPRGRLRGTAPGRPRAAAPPAPPGTCGSARPGRSSLAKLRAIAALVLAHDQSLSALAGEADGHRGRGPHLRGRGHLQVPYPVEDPHAHVSGRVTGFGHGAGEVHELAVGPGDVDVVLDQFGGRVQAGRIQVARPVPEPPAHLQQGVVGLGCPQVVGDGTARPGSGPGTVCHRRPRRP